MVFGFGGGSGGSGGGGGQSVAMSPQLISAEAELEMITDTFNKLVTSCHQKCISTRYTEADLNKGESVCIDRCVAKYFLVNKMVGEKMQALGGAAASSGGGNSGSFF